MKIFIMFSAMNSAGWKKEDLRSRAQAEKFLLPTLISKDGGDVRREVGEGNVLSPVRGAITSSIKEMDDDSREKRGFQPLNGDTFTPETWVYGVKKKEKPAIGFEIELLSSEKGAVVHVTEAAIATAKANEDAAEAIEAAEDQAAAAQNDAKKARVETAKAVEAQAKAEAEAKRLAEEIKTLQAKLKADDKAAAVK